MTVKGKEDVKEYNEGTTTAVATATAVSTAGNLLLDAQTIELLSRMDSFFIQQRIRFVEAGTGGCFEQPNVYDVFDKQTNKRIMVRIIISLIHIHTGRTERLLGYTSPSFPLIYLFIILNIPIRLSSSLYLSTKIKIQQY